VFNLTPFRGPSADAGTVFELGFMYSKGKHTDARPGPTQRLRPAEAVARRRTILVRGSEIAIMLKKRIGEPNSTLAENDA